MELDELKQDNLDAESENDDHIIESTPKEKQSPPSFNVGEQLASIKQNGIEIEVHFTNTEPERAVELCNWLFDRARSEPTKPTPQYTQ